MAFGAHRLPPARYLTRTCPAWHAQSGLLDGHALDHDLLLRMAGLAVRTGRSHLLYDVQTRHDGAERRVTRRERSVLVDEEELAAVAVGCARVSHRHGSRRVRRSGQVLVSEPVARSAAARTGWVAALQHEDAAGHQAMAVGVAEVALAGQVDERVDRARALGVKQVNTDAAAVGLVRRLVGRL